GSTTWYGLDVSGAPPDGRVNGSAVYDPVRDRLLVFGGMDPLDNYLDDVWALSLSGTPTWTRLSPPRPEPAARAGHTATYDPVRDRMVVFGGRVGGTPLNDVWELSLAASPAWSQVTPSGSPPDSGQAAVYDPVRGRMLVFAGDDSKSGLDVWALSLSETPAW